jgi:tRNA A37 threonylcarbamoyladenosine dehydratase
VKDIWKTYGDKLAKKFRYELKKAGFKGKFDVVFSPEEPKCIELGSFMAVTGSFGLTLCSLVAKRILS